MKVPVCSGWSVSIVRQPDGSGFYLHCTGGVRFAERKTDVWHVEPIFNGNGACANGFMTKLELQRFIHQNGLKPIAFHTFNWHRGSYHSGWSPIMPGRTEHRQGPADLWGHIATNLAGDRTATEINAIEDPTHENLAKVLDGKGEVERLAHSISLSLRSMDIAVEQIADFYNEKLVDLMSSKSLNGQRSGSFADGSLYAHVHSFFLHLGAARDYMGALIAFRLGKDPRKTDALSRLEGVLRLRDLAGDALLSLLTSKGYLRQKENTADKIEVVGWLKDVADLRKEFVHHRPYGVMFLEQSGYAVEVSKGEGVYKYTRPFARGGEDEADILDVIAENYSTACGLFYELAELSGYEISMMTLSDEDILSVQIDG